MEPSLASERALLDMMETEKVDEEDDGRRGCGDDERLVCCGFIFDCHRSTKASMNANAFEM
jgi:hypothetical protein